MSNNKAPAGHPVYRLENSDNVLLGVRVPATLHARFSETCKRRGLTMSEVIRGMIEGYCEPGVTR